jgi:outer membrane protein assembly factor BamB
VAAEAVPHEGHHSTHSYAAGSPTTDGERLYVPFGSQGIYCYDLSGKLLWKRSLGRMNTRLGWGEGASPSVKGDTLVVPWDQEKSSFVIALDARTGETRWKKDRDEPTNWATPLLVDYQGRTQAILNAKNRVRSYDLSTGKLLWECGGQTLNAIPSPIRYRDTVICMSGYKGSFSVSIPLDASGDLTGTNKVAWTHEGGTPYVPSAVLAGDRLYFTQMNDPILCCLDAGTGKVVFQGARLPGLRTLYASPLAASGRLYIGDREGTMLVLEQGDRLKVLATNRLGEGVDASPVAVDEQLFLRGQKHLYCIEAEKKP